MKMITLLIVLGIAACGKRTAPGNSLSTKNADEASVGFSEAEEKFYARVLTSSTLSQQRILALFLQSRITAAGAKKIDRRLFLRCSGEEFCDISPKDNL